MRVYKIGRDASCDVTLDDDSVSRNHAELLTLEDGRLYLTDCASTNGTCVVRDAQRQPVRQTFVRRSDHVCFGNRQLTVAELLQKIAPARPDQEENHARSS